MLLHHKRRDQDTGWGTGLVPQCSGMSFCRVIREDAQLWQQLCTDAVLLPLVLQAHPGMEEPGVHTGCQFSQDLTSKSDIKTQIRESGLV